MSAHVNRTVLAMTRKVKDAANEATRRGAVGKAGRDQLHTLALSAGQQILELAKDSPAHAANALQTLAIIFAEPRFHGRLADTVRQLEELAAQARREAAPRSDGTVENLLARAAWLETSVRNAVAQTLDPEVTDRGYWVLQDALEELRALPQAPSVSEMERRIIDLQMEVETRLFELRQVA
jgi:hypothetical protein